MKVKLSSSAIRDIESGCDFYRSIDLKLAVYFNNSVAEDIGKLALYGGIHAKCDGLHYTFATSFPFVIWYEVLKDTVLVYAVLDGRRDPEENESILRNRREELG